MLHNPKRSFQSDRLYAPPAQEARRLRLEFNRLQRRLSALQGQSGSESEFDALWGQIARVARDLGLVRADSAHAVECKLKVALDLMGDGPNETSHRLLSSALSDLHYLSMLSDPKPG